jgi:hypothetical protein
MNSVWFACLSVLLLSACGGRKSENPDYSYRWTYDTGNDRYSDPVAVARQMVRDARVTCRDSAHCTPSVALFAFASGTNVGMCTAFLISPDTMLTNSHCIEGRPDTMKVFFPETQGYSQDMTDVTRFERPSTIDSSSQSKIGKLPDYVFLKLQRRVSRPVLSINSAGVQDGTKLRILSVRPKSESEVVGQLEEQDCESVMNSAVVPGYTQPVSAVIAFSGCTVEHGNSGSPVVDQTGQVRAIAQAGLSAEARDRVRRTLNLPEIVPLNMGTEMACIPFNENARLPDACQSTIKLADLADGIELVLKNIQNDPNAVAKLEKKLTAEAKSWTSSRPKELRWKLSYAGDEYTLKPYCALKTASATTAWNEELPIWKMQASFDSKLRAEVSIQRGAA